MDNRELAGLVAVGTIVLVAIIAARQSGEPLRLLSSLWDALRGMGVVLPVVLCCYGAGVVILLAAAARYGWWDWTLWPKAVAWFFLSGFGLFDRGMVAVRESGVFWHTLRRLLKFAFWFEIFSGSFAFPLWVEIPTAQVAAWGLVCLMFAGEEPGASHVRTFVNVFFGCFAVAVVIWTAYQALVGWREFDWLLLQELLMPIWLVPVALVLMFPITLYATYELMWKLIKVGADGKQYVGPRAATVVYCTVRLGVLRNLLPYAQHIGRTGSFRAAWRMIRAIPRR